MGLLDKIKEQRGKQSVGNNTSGGLLDRVIEESGWQGVELNTGSNRASRYVNEEDRRQREEEKEKNAKRLALYRQKVKREYEKLKRDERSSEDSEFSTGLNETKPTASERAAERAAAARGNPLDSIGDNDPLRSSARYLYSDAALKKNAEAIDALGGKGTTASMRAALAAEQIAKTAPKKTTSVLDRYTPAKDTLGNLKDAISADYKADRFASVYDNMIGSGASEALKAGAWGTAIGENTRYHNEKVKEKILEQFGSMEAYEDAVRAYELGWYKGEVDPEGAAARVERRAEIAGELSKINSDIKRLKENYTDDDRIKPTDVSGYRVDSGKSGQDVKYREQLSALEEKKKRLENEAYLYDSFQAKIDAGDQAALDQLEMQSAGWTAGKFDPEGAGKRQEIKARKEARIAEIDAELEEFDRASGEFEEFDRASNEDIPALNDKALNKKKVSLTKEKERLQAEINKYARMQEPLDVYSGVVNNSDFKEVVANRQGELAEFEKEHNIGRGGFGTYDNPMNAGTGGNQRYWTDVLRTLTEKDSTWRELTDEEKDVYYYLFEKGGEAAANKWLGDLSNVLGMRRSGKIESDLEDVNTIEKTLNNAAMTPVRIGSGYNAGVENALNKITGKSVNPYTGANLQQQIAKESVGAAAAGLDEAMPWFNVLGQTPGKLYQATVSGVDSFLQMSALGHGAEFGMALSAMSATESDLWEKGATDTQIAVEGTLSGIFEAMFEHLSIEMFLNNFMNAAGTSPFDLVKKGAMQILAEGSEEVATDIANFTTDALTMRSQSEWEEIFNKYKEQGMTDGQAVWNGIKNDVVAGKLWDSFVGGAVGALVTTGGGTLSGYQMARQTGTDVKSKGTESRLVKAAEEIAEKIPDESKRATVEKAAAKAQKTKSAADIGFLLNAVENAVNNDIEDAEEQNKAAQTVARAVLGANDYTRATYVAKDAEDNGAPVAVDKESPVARIEGDTVYMNTDRGPVELSDLAFEDDEVRDMIYRVAEYGAEHANDILSNYGGEDVEAYVSGMKEGILKGQYGDLGEELSDFNALSAADQKVALNIGRTIRADRVAAEAQQTQTRKIAAFDARGRDLKTVYTATRTGQSGTKGTVRLASNVDAKTELEKANVEFIKAVAEMRGADYAVFDSIKDPELKTRNGFYNAEDGTIWVDIHAGEGRQGLVAPTLGHEMTHDARTWAPEAYRAYCDFLIKNYTEAGVSTDRLVRQKMAESGIENYDDALEDVVADASGRFLLDKYAPQKIAELEKTEPSLAKKIVAWIKNAISKLKEAYQTLKATGRWEQTAAAEALDKIGDKIDEVAWAWGLTVDEAAQGRKAAAERAARGETEKTSPHPSRQTATPSPQGEGSETKYSTRTGAAEVQTEAEEKKSERDSSTRAAALAQNDRVVTASARTGVSTSTKAVVERALETAKEGSPEKTALTAYKKVLDQIEVQVEAYNEARKNRDAAAAAEAKKQLNTLQARARKMETAPAMQNVAAMKDVTALNEDVRNLSRLLKLQGRETGGAIALKSSLEKAASDLMKEHGVRRGKAELVEMLNNFYVDMTREVRAETLNREYMLAAAQPVAEWLVDNAPNQTEIDTEINDVLKYIKGSKIRVNDQQRGDIENKYESFEEWRKSLFPYVTVTTDPSAPTLDSFWSDLAEQYPDYFDANLSWADQGVELSGVLSNLKSGRVTEYYLSDEARNWLIEAAANDVAEAFWGIKPYKTVADKYAEEIKRLKEDHKSFRSIDEYIQDQKQAAFDLGYTRAKMQEARREFRRKIRTLAENMSSRLTKPKQNRYIPESLQAATAEVLTALDLDSGRSESLSEKFAQLRDQYAKIIEKQKQTNSKNKKNDERYPITTENSVVNDLLTLVTERIKGVAVKDMTTSQLDTVYTALKAFDHEIKNAMNAEEMNTLLDERMTVQDIGERLIEEVREEHKERDRKTGEVKKDKKGREIKNDRKDLISRYFDYQVRPEEFFNNLAGYKKNSMWHRVYEMLNNAQRKQIMYEMQGQEIFREVLADEDYVRSLSARGKNDLLDIGLKDQHENPYRVTRGMMLSIYKHLQNEDNERHIMVGGLVAPDFDAYYSGQSEDVYDEENEDNENRIFGVIGKELATAYENIEKRIADLDDRWEAAMIRSDAESMDMIAAERDAAWSERDEILERGRAIMDQIRKNIESKLTDQDRALLAASDKFFSEFSPEILNDATKRMYGFDKARVENYFPIHVSSDFLTANFEAVKHDFSVEGMGFMKDRVQSSKPILLEDIGDVIDKQIRNVAKYAALAPALKDFSKVFSVSTGGTEYSRSVSSAIKGVFGERGIKYLENLIADLNGARDREVGILDKLRSRGAGAVLMMNPRVSMVQAASYATAAAELGYGPLAQALLNPEGKSVVVKKAPMDLIAKYTPMLWTRAQGNIDASVAAVKKLGNTRGLAEKKLRFLSGWIEAVDNATVGRLWYASEYYVQKKNPEMKGYKSSPDQAKVDEYYMKVAEVFSDVIERTQPNYTVMQRPAVLRSTNAMTKALTMFLTQRLQNASILYSATKRYAKYVSDYNMRTDKKSDVGRNGVTKADVKQAGADLARAVTSQLVSAATIAGMRLVADMLLRNMKGRRDDDKEVTGESIGWSILNDFFSSAASNFLGGSELYEVISKIVTGNKYYGINIGGFDNVNDFVTNVVDVGQNIVGLIKGEESFDTNKASKIAMDLGNLTGIPVSNAYKILKAIKSWGEAWEHESAAKGNLWEYGDKELWEFGPPDRTNKQKASLMLKAYRDGNSERFLEIRKQFETREKADENLFKAVYEEWAAGDLSDDDALKILEDCLSPSKAPDTDNERRIQLEDWENKKANEGLPKNEQTSYSEYDDLTASMTDYVYEKDADKRLTAGKNAQAMVEQYRAWGYTDKQIRDKITDTFKPEYQFMTDDEKDDVKGYIVKLYEFAGKDPAQASKDIDKWKPTEKQIAEREAAENGEEEEEDERPFG